MKTRNVLLVAMFSVSGASAVQAAPILTNGNFADNAPSYIQSPGYNYAHSPSNPFDPYAWTDNGVGNQGVNGPDTAVGGPFAPLNQSTVDFGFLQYPGAALYQTFAVTPGVIYTVSYTDAARVSEKTDQDLVSIQDGAFNGTLLASQSESPDDSHFTAEPSFQFTAASTTATIVLQNTTPGTFDLDRTVDFTNVSVTTLGGVAVPEPATAGLLAVACFGVLRRRRNA